MAKDGKTQEVKVEGTVVSVFYPGLKKGVKVDVGTFSAKLLMAAALHGVKQRLGDAESGKEAPEKYAMVQRILDEAFAQNSWDLTTRVIDPKLVVEAMARVLGEKEEKVRASLEKIEDEEARKEKLREWRQHPLVKAEVLKIQAARATAAAAEAEDLPSLD